MPEHKLQAGRTLIEGLVTLGRWLGYYVKPECAVQKSNKNPPAVDVAWMADDTQEFPLMIFEVESTAGNTMANSVNKVYGQSTEQFEKPLFFFHAVLRSGESTSRIDTLRGEYGRMNYRLYRLDHDEKTQLLLDILSQHRRLKRTIDLPGLHELLKHEAWGGVDDQRVMDHLEKLEYATSFLAAYARLSVQHAAYGRTFIARLRKEEERYPHRTTATGYNTYLGESWERPVHLALLARSSPEKSVELLDRLRNWQESHSSTMVGPHFGLSKDYDEFVIGMAPGFLAAVAAVFGQPEIARAYLAEQIRVIVQELGRARSRFAFYSAVWLLHVAATLAEDHLFEFGRGFVNRKGGIPETCVLHPPFGVPSYDECDACPWDEDLQGQCIQVPDKVAFSALIRESNPGLLSEEVALSLGIRLLIANGSSEQFAEHTIRLLSSGV